MNKRLIFAPFAAFVALSGYVGWQLGQPLSETDVLASYAKEWVATGPVGAVSSDCRFYQNGPPEVWITVVCQRAGALQSTEIAPDGRVLSVFVF